MSNIAIITDSASDIKQNNNKNITVLPLTVSFDDNHYKMVWILHLMIFI